MRPGRPAPARLVAPRSATPLLGGEPIASPRLAPRQRCPPSCLSLALCPRARSHIVAQRGPGSPTPRRLRPTRRDAKWSRGTTRPSCREAKWFGSATLVTLVTLVTPCPCAFPMCDRSRTCAPLPLPPLATDYGDRPRVHRLPLLQSLQPLTEQSAMFGTEIVLL